MPKSIKRLVSRKSTIKRLGGGSSEAEMSKAATKIQAKFRQKEASRNVALIRLIYQDARRLNSSEDGSQMDEKEAREMTMKNVGEAAKRCVKVFHLTQARGKDGNSFEELSKTLEAELLWGALVEYVNHIEFMENILEACNHHGWDLDLARRGGLLLFNMLVDGGNSKLPTKKLHKMRFKDALTTVTATLKIRHESDPTDSQVKGAYLLATHLTELGENAWNVCAHSPPHGKSAETVAIAREVVAEAEEEQAAEAARIAQEAKEKGETEEMGPSVEHVSSSFMGGGEEEEHLSPTSGGTEVMLQSMAHKIHSLKAVLCLMQGEDAAEDIAGLDEVLENLKTESKSRRGSQVASPMPDTNHSELLSHEDVSKSDQPAVQDSSSKVSSDHGAAHLLESFATKRIDPDKKQSQASGDEAHANVQSSSRSVHSSEMAPDLTGEDDITPDAHVQDSQQTKESIDDFVGNAESEEVTFPPLPKEFSQDEQKQKSVLPEAVALREATLPPKSEPRDAIENLDMGVLQHGSSQGNEVPESNEVPGVVETATGNLGSLSEQSQNAMTAQSRNSVPSSDSTNPRNAEGKKADALNAAGKKADYLRTSGGETASKPPARGESHANDLDSRDQVPAEPAQTGGSSAEETRRFGNHLLTGGSSAEELVLHQKADSEVSRQHVPRWRQTPIKVEDLNARPANKFDPVVATQPLQGPVSFGSGALIAQRSEASIDSQQPEDSAFPAFSAFPTWQQSFSASKRGVTVPTNRTVTGLTISGAPPDHGGDCVNGAYVYDGTHKGKTKYRQISNIPNSKEMDPGRATSTNQISNIPHGKEMDPGRATSTNQISNIPHGKEVDPGRATSTNLSSHGNNGGQVRFETAGDWGSENLCGGADCWTFICNRQYRYYIVSEANDPPTQGWQAVQGCAAGSPTVTIRSGLRSSSSKSLLPVSRDPTDEDIQMAREYHHALTSVFASMPAHKLEGVLADLGCGSLYYHLRSKSNLSSSQRHSGDSKVHGFCGKHLLDGLFPDGPDYPMAGSHHVLAQLGKWAQNELIQQKKKQSKSPRRAPPIYSHIPSLSPGHVDVSCRWTEWSMRKRLTRAKPREHGPHGLLLHRAY